MAAKKKKAARKKAARKAGKASARKRKAAAGPRLPANPTRRSPSLFRAKKWKKASKGNSTSARRLRAALAGAGGGGFMITAPNAGPGADHG